MSGVHVSPIFDLIDVGTRPPMQHCLGPGGLDRYWCGASRDPNKPVEGHRLVELDCVVCFDLYRTNGPWWR